DIDNGRKEALFFTLLNSRVLMRIIEAVCADFGVDLSEGIKHIDFDITNKAFISLFKSVSGKESYNEAEIIENEICNLADSVLINYDFPTVNELLLWNVIERGTILYKQKPINKKLLIMLDDIQDLSPKQRILISKLLQGVFPTARWIAERYQDLRPEDIIEPGANEGREYKIHRLEHWASQSKAKFQKGLVDIASKRVRMSGIVDVSSFEVLLETVENKTTYESKYCLAVDTIYSRINSNSQYGFNDWINKTINMEGNLFEKAVALRELEILIERKKRRENTLFPEIEFPVLEMDKMSSTSVQNAAKLFISKEFKIPYYFGIDILKTLSSWNIEQFLNICGNLFSEIMAAATLRKSKQPILAAMRQQAIIKDIAKKRLDEMPIRITNGSQIKNLVLNLANLCQKLTYAPNAPYAPGVTGFAIGSSDWDNLCSSSFLEKKPRLKNLAYVLRDAIAYNILEVRMPVFCKHHEWVVLYLNRLYCANYWLPLDYGGFKEQKLDLLLQWLEAPTEGITKEGLFKDA
ncbi:MAG: hypothetical protein ABRQ26_15305, partial [Syntrophomonadaceae bacterium]